MSDYTLQREAHFLNGDFWPKGEGLLLGDSAAKADVQKDFILIRFPCSTGLGRSNNKFNASGPFMDAPDALISASQGPRRPQLRTTLDQWRASGQK